MDAVADLSPATPRPLPALPSDELSRGQRGPGAEAFLDPPSPPLHDAGDHPLPSGKSHPWGR